MNICFIDEQLITFIFTFCFLLLWMAKEAKIAQVIFFIDRLEGYWSKLSVLLDAFKHCYMQILNSNSRKSWMLGWSNISPFWMITIVFFKSCYHLWLCFNFWCLNITIIKVKSCALKLIILHTNQSRRIQQRSLWNLA